MALKVANTIALSAGMCGFFSNTTFAGTSLTVKGTPVAIGTASAYTSGGSPGVNTIDKYPFSTDTNASDVGDLVNSIDRVRVGNMSDTCGFTAGGYRNSPAVTLNNIEVSPFASDTNASSGGALADRRRDASSFSSPTHGYVATGEGPGGGYSNIERFPFASLSPTSGGVRTGNLDTSGNYAYNSVGTQAEFQGYVTGGNNNNTCVRCVAFASDASGVFVGTISPGTYSSGSTNSINHSYILGGRTGGVNQNCIKKFSHTSHGAGSDVGDLISARRDSTSHQASSNHGYTAGGGAPANNDAIQKFPFATDTNASCIGSLTQARQKSAGFSD